MRAAPSWPDWLERRPTRRVAVAHTFVTPESRLDDQDTLEEIATVSEALLELGFEPHPVPLTLDLGAFVAALGELEPAFVFNLVEGVDGSGRLIHIAPALCEHLGLACTGAPSSAVLATTSKLEAKRLLRIAGLPTAPWATPAELARGHVGFAGPYILKPVWEDASVGIDHGGVCAGADRLLEMWRARTACAGGEYFAERYIEGREINQALLAGPRGPRALPMAEIDFLDWEEGAPRIVSWRAKWDEHAPEFERTRRRFSRGRRDAGLRRRVKALARRCWHLFGLHGYARVDLRIDRRGHPYVLEVNANPCISPDAGFLAAAREVGMQPAEVVACIIRDCLPPSGPPAGGPRNHPRPELA